MSSFILPTGGPAPSGDLQQDLAIKRLKPLDLIQENIDNINAEDALEELMARLSLQGATLRAALDSLYDYFEVKAESIGAA